MSQDLPHVKGLMGTAVMGYTALDHPVSLQVQRLQSAHGLTLWVVC